jgi:hypothetical protein
MNGMAARLTIWQQGKREFGYDISKVQMRMALIYR